MATVTDAAADRGAAPAPRHWPPVLTVEPIAAARGEVRLPGSKSMSNRALLLAALARGATTLTGLLDADDTRVMIAALQALGVRVVRAGDATRVEGCGGRFPVTAAQLHLGNAGTAMRSLTAALAFAGGSYRLDGVARMRERPIGDLVEALNAMGARIGYVGAAGFPPLQIDPCRWCACAATSRASSSAACSWPRRPGRPPKAWTWPSRASSSRSPMSP
jgi:5-enolpyruvylshikimate-3-phosphate synthase